MISCLRISASAYAPLGGELDDAVVAERGTINLARDEEEPEHIRVERRARVRPLYTQGHNVSRCIHIDADTNRTYIHRQGHVVVLAFQRLREDAGVGIADGVAPPWAPDHCREPAHAFTHASAAGPAHTRA